MNRMIPALSLGAILLLVVGFYVGWSFFVVPGVEPRPLRPSVTGPGSIRGRITFGGPIPASRDRYPSGIDPGACPHVVRDESLEVGQNGGLKNAVVTVHDVPGVFEATIDDNRVLDQVGCVFKPHILPVVKGAAVSFKNSDTVAHNTHIHAMKNSASNVTISAGETHELVFAEAERMEITCNIHPWMLAWIVVHENRYIAVTDANGEYEIHEIPPGDYRVRVWHEAASMDKRSVMIRSGKTAVLDSALRPTK